MADNAIPPVFRSALDEPAPPDPPEIEPERDDDDGGGWHACPVLIVFANGWVHGHGLPGALLVVGVLASVGLNALTALALLWWWLSAYGFAQAAFNIGTAIVLGGATAVIADHLVSRRLKRRRAANAEQQP